MARNLGTGENDGERRGWSHWKIRRSCYPHLEWQIDVEKHCWIRLQSSRSINWMGKKEDPPHFLDLWI
eukprot:3440532-Heterocapsa_arctica.AAC.1